MAALFDNDLWLQSRRIGLAKGRIAALDDIRLRLIEMADAAAANTVASLIDRLRTDLDYQTQVMVAMQARAAVTRIEQPAGVDAPAAKSGADHAGLVVWQDIAPPAPSAHQAA